jgi:chromosome segregation ATPase
VDGRAIFFVVARTTVESKSAKRSLVRKMGTDKCSICLEEMVSGIGVAVPCGHCFHVACFARLKADCSLTCPDSKPPCPLCKRKVKKFHKVYLTVSQRQPEQEESSIADVRKEKVRLQKRLRELKRLTNDQSDLLFRILPRYDHLETRYSHTKQEKRNLKKRLEALEDENWELLIDSFEVKTTNRNLETQLEQANGENMDLHAIWDNLEDQLEDQISQKKRATQKLKQQVQEQVAHLAKTKKGMSKLKAETKVLRAAMTQSRDEVVRLRKKLKHSPRKRKATWKRLSTRPNGNARVCT